MHIDARWKILRYPEYLARMKQGKRVYPLNIEVDLSNACNLRCDWCLYSYTHDGTLMSLELADKIISELASLGALAITFSGGGEPTLNPHFVSIVRLANVEHGLDCGVYTNGVLIDPIVDASQYLRWIYVGLDADYEDAYLELKKRDHFHTVIENVNHLVECAGMTTIGLGFLLHQGNWHRVIAMIRLAESLRVDYVQFRPALGFENYNWAYPLLRELDDWLEEECCSIPVYINRDRLFDLYNHCHGLHTRGYSICRASEVVPTIGSDGSVWVCSNMRGFRKLGDLKTETFADVWARRPTQFVGDDCQVNCRNHELNKTLEFVCAAPAPEEHAGFV